MRCTVISESLLWICHWSDAELILAVVQWDYTFIRRYGIRELVIFRSSYWHTVCISVVFIFSRFKEFLIYVVPCINKQQYKFTNKNCHLWCTAVVCHVGQLSTTPPLTIIHRCDKHRVTKKDTQRRESVQTVMLYDGMDMIHCKWLLRFTCLQYLTANCV